MDEQGLRHGNGTCTWMDGTYYQGEWKLGKRDGHGKFVRCDGYTYTGGYKEDMQHGDGEERDPQGNVSKCPWVNNFKHGKGTFTLAGGEPKETVFHFGLVIPEQDMHVIGFKTDCMGCNLVLVLAMWFFLGMLVLCIGTW